MLVAYWIFAFEYYSIARMMPFAIQGAPMLARMIRVDNYIYYIFLSLNILLPLLAAVFSTIANSIFFTNPIDGKNGFEVRVLQYLNFMISLLGVISGVFLLHAIFRIRKFIKKGIQTKQINDLAMTVHILAYSLYMLSILVHQIINVYYFLAGNTFRLLKLDTISNFFDATTGTLS